MCDSVCLHTTNHVCLHITNHVCPHTTNHVWLLFDWTGIICCILYPVSWG